MIDSLARPGGNTTRLTNVAAELGGKWLELLKETVPKLTRVALLWGSTEFRLYAGMERKSIAGTRIRLTALFYGTKQRGRVRGCV
jgi:putative ABC transport system substrate-binding protein